MSELPNYEDYVLSDSQEYVFGEQVVGLLDDPSQQEQVTELLTETQAVAKAWLDSKNPVTQHRYEDVVKQFDLLTPEVPDHIADDSSIRHDVVAWIAQASPGALTNFMRWNVAEHQATQAHFETQLPQLEQRIHADVARLVQEGHLPPQAIDAYQQSVAQTKEIRAIDPITVGERHADGYYYLGEYRMGLNGALAYSVEADEAYRVFMHEHGHGVEAVGFKGLHDFCDSLDAGWFREGFNEHTTQAALSGEFTVLSPAERNLEGTYQPNRLLIHALTQLGAIAIPPKALADAYFAAPDQDLARHQALRQNIEASYAAAGDYPEGLLTRISREYSDNRLEVKNGEVMKRWYDTLTAAVGHAGLSAEALLQSQPTITIQSVPSSQSLGNGEITGYIYI